MADYVTDFDMSLMSHAQWREYYWFGCPRWWQFSARLRWNVENAILRYKLEAHGVVLYPKPRRTK